TVGACDRLLKIRSRQGAAWCGALPVESGGGGLSPAGVVVHREAEPADVLVPGDVLGGDDEVVDAGAKLPRVEPPRRELEQVAPCLEVRVVVPEDRHVLAGPAGEGAPELVVRGKRLAHVAGDALGDDELARPALDPPADPRRGDREVVPDPGDGKR